MKARITAIASYLPEKVLSNQDLEKIVDTSDEWIVTRTGMKERRIASEKEHPSTMGAEAARKVLKKRGMEASDLDMILVGTMTPDYMAPSTAALVQAELGASGSCFAMDFQAACSGFLYGLSLAKAYIESGMYKKVLLIASEKLTPFLDYTDRNTCILFGDGAAAVLVEAEGSGMAIESINLGADGEQGGLLKVEAGGSRMPASLKTLEERKHYVQMNGKELFKHAVRRMESAVIDCLERSSLKEEDISYLVPHQANLRIIEGLAKRFSIPAERVYKVLHKYGNTSASSVPIALTDLVAEKEIQKDEKLLLVAFGAGLTWGAAILNKIEGE